MEVLPEEKADNLLSPMLGIMEEYTYDLRSVLQINDILNRLSYFLLPHLVLPDLTL
jgi:hypothetical protein